MKHINVLWPDALNDEYMKLFQEYCDSAPATELEDDDLFDARVTAYIDRNASKALKDWLRYVEELERDYA